MQNISIQFCRRYSYLNKAWNQKMSKKFNISNWLDSQTKLNSIDLIDMKPNQNIFDNLEKTYVSKDSL